MIELVLEDANMSVADEFALARVLHQKRRDIIAKCRDQYYERREANGLCQRCPSPAKPGRTHCQPCIDRKVAANRARKHG